MNTPQDIRIDAFDYPLPDERIAKYPIAQRDQSKLLVYRNGNISHTVFNRLPELLTPGSLIVFNNTKVIQARLHFRKETGALVEIFCLEPFEPSDYALMFQKTHECSWLCLVGNLKKWKEGSLSRTLETTDGQHITLKATRGELYGNSYRIHFEWSGPHTFADILDLVGELPIPPYLNRATEESDKTTYQTVYSKIKGSVAAPTAGLHFTEKVLNALDERRIERDEVTLHVGAGTFKPVKSEKLDEHEMHTEYICVTRKNIENLIRHHGRCTAVGTTSVRTLESLYYIGTKLSKNPDLTEKELHVNQWEPYDASNNGLQTVEALEQIVAYLERNRLPALHTSTQIIIAPGYQYRIVEAIVTNFHQPKSTLLLLVSAFLGEERWKDVYRYALENDFRFLSYGDSSLLIP